MNISMLLSEISKRDDLCEVARKKIEDVLIEFRDARISIFGRGNGLVVAEKDGTPSHVMRLTVEASISIALLAIAEYLDKSPEVAEQLYDLMQNKSGEQ